MRSRNMGMFDSFIGLLNCAKCGHYQERYEYQTKELDCMLDLFEFPAAIDRQDMVITEIEHCPSCGKDISAKFYIKNGIWYKLVVGIEIICETRPSDELREALKRVDTFKAQLQKTRSVAIALGVVLVDKDESKAGIVKKVLASAQAVANNEEFNEYTERCHAYVLPKEEQTAMLALKSLRGSFGGPQSIYGKLVTDDNGQLLQSY